MWEGVFVFVDAVWYGYGFDSIEEVIHGGSEESKGAYSKWEKLRF